MGIDGKVWLGKTELKVVSRSDILIKATTPRGISAGQGQPLLVFYGEMGPILLS